MFPFTVISLEHAQYIQMIISNLYLPFFPPVYVRHTSRNIQQELGMIHLLMTILLTVLCMSMYVRFGSSYLLSGSAIILGSVNNIMYVSIYICMYMYVYIHRTK